MNPKIRLTLAAAFLVLALASLSFAWLFMHLLEPSLPIIPLAAAANALLSAGACGWHIAEMFHDMERAK